MASIKQALATAAALTITVASLASAAGRASTAVDNSSNLYTAADVEVKLKTGGSGASATGRIDVYLLRSADGTTYDDAFGGTDAAYTPVNALLIGSLAATANSTTYVGIFGTDQVAPTLPAKWAIGIWNASGTTLSATAGDHEVKVREKYLTVA